MQTIVINKSLIPYDFNISLNNELFNFRIDYNNTGRFFTVELTKNGEVLCSGEPIIYGRKLFADVKKPSFPKVDIVPRDPSGDYDTVTYENLCESVLLIVNETAGE